MDLKIKDVAELLNVSETTIRRWLKDGKIPAYQLNHQYRFSRGEIEDWMMRCKLNLGKDGFSPFEEKQIYPVPQDPDPSAQRGGTQQFSLYRAMHKGGVLVDIPAKNKTQLIKTVMQMAAPRLGLDPDLMTELLLDREALMSTALNSGIAVPHPRDILLELPGSDALITVFPQKPIDYDALDGQPVHTLFFLFSSSDKTHLHLLSKLAHLTSQPAIL
ncbi:MAG: PTS sugar transporter subunit IIA, partial [Thermodesulfobacteriota bacterium]